MESLVLKQLVSKQEQVLQLPWGRILFPPLYFNFHELHKLDENSILTKFIKVKSHFEMGVIVTEFTVAFRLRTYGKCWRGPHVHKVSKIGSTF